MLIDLCGSVVEHDTFTNEDLLSFDPLVVLVYLHIFIKSLMMHACSPTHIYSAHCRPVPCRDQGVPPIQSMVNRSLLFSQALLQLGLPVHVQMGTWIGWWQAMGKLKLWHFWRQFTLWVLGLAWPLTTGQWPLPTLIKEARPWKFQCSMWEAFCSERAAWGVSRHWGSSHWWDFEVTVNIHKDQRSWRGPHRVAACWSGLIVSHVR